MIEAEVCPICRCAKPKEVVRCGSCDKMPSSWRSAIEESFETIRELVGLPGQSDDNIKQLARTAADMSLIARRFAAGYRLVTIKGTITEESARATIGVLEDSCPDCWNVLVVDSTDGDPKAAMEINKSLNAAQYRGSLAACIIERACGPGLLCVLGKFFRAGIVTGKIGNLANVGLSEAEVRDRLNDATTWRSLVRSDGRMCSIRPVSDHLVKTCMEGKSVSMEAAEASHLLNFIAPNFEIAEIRIAVMLGHRRNP